MRVAIVTRRYWPAIGGVERVAMGLGEGLHERGHCATVVAQCVDEGPFRRMTHIIRENERFEPFEHNGVQVLQFRPSRLRRSLLLPFALELLPFAGRISQRWLRRHTARYYTAVVRGVLEPLLADADLVHVLGGEVMAAAAIDTARRLRKPTAISPFAHPGDWGMDAGSISAYRAADLVMATTNADAGVYRGIGVPEERLRVVGLPVPYIPPPADVGSSEPPPGEAPLIVFLGARRPTKGVDVLLDAAPHVWERHGKARFAFVGPGAPLSMEDDRLLDIGPVSDAERAAWLARATLLCLPSAGESFGLVVAEAWSHGVPVVVSDIPVLKELVERSGGGALAARTGQAVAAAIADMLDDRSQAAALGALGHRFWLEHLTPEAVMQRHLEIYEELLTGHCAAATAPLPR